MNFLFLVDTENAYDFHSFKWKISSKKKVKFFSRSRQTLHSTCCDRINFAQQFSFVISYLAYTKLTLKLCCGWTKLEQKKWNLSSSEVLWILPMPQTSRFHLTFPFIISFLNIHFTPLPPSVLKTQAQAQLNRVMLNSAKPRFPSQQCRLESLLVHIAQPIQSYVDEKSVATLSLSGYFWNFLTFSKSSETFFLFLVFI